MRPTDIDPDPEETMTTCGIWPVGVCSWSLRTDIAGVAGAMKKIGLEWIHLDIGPALEPGGDEYLAAVRKKPWTISSTMIGFPQEDYATLETIQRTGGIAPDEQWETNRELTFKAVKRTAGLNVQYLSMHAGFIDEGRPGYARKFQAHIQCLADAARDAGILLLMETGQETAEDLKHFLDRLDHPALGVNFDPANMLLYGQGDPIAAVKILGPWIKHVHIKDAVRTKTPGTWGEEEAWGEGQVCPEAFLKALKAVGFQGVLAIAREAGGDRFADLRSAAERLEAFAG